MAVQLINRIKDTKKYEKKVKCTVAPYEADAQLSYLSKEGLVDAVISEDSDCIPWGCKEMLFKLKNDGTCESVKLADVYSTLLPGLDLREFTPEMTISLCIAAGCDYLDSVKGFGIKNSYKFIYKYKTPERMLKAMRLAGNIPLIAAKNITVRNGSGNVPISSTSTVVKWNTDETMNSTSDLSRSNCDNNDNVISSSGDADTINNDYNIDTNENPNNTVNDDNNSCGNINKDSNITENNLNDENIHIDVVKNNKVSATKSSLLQYELGFYKALATFKHQTIFDVRSREVSLR